MRCRSGQSDRRAPVMRSGYTRPGVPGFKVERAIYLHSRENFAYTYPIGKFGPKRPRPARRQPHYYYTTSRTICQYPISTKNHLIFCKYCTNPGKNARKTAISGGFWSLFRLSMASKGQTVAIFTNFEGDFSFRVHNFDQIHTRSRNFFFHVVKTFHCAGNLFNQ